MEGKGREALCMFTVISLEGGGICQDEVDEADEVRKDLGWGGALRIGWIERERCMMTRSAPISQVPPVFVR